MTNILFYIFVIIGAYPCPFKPFQVIPYSHNGPPTKFTHKSVKTLLRCTLLTRPKARPQVKFSEYTEEMDLQWLDPSYVNFTVSKKDLYFKVCYWIRLFSVLVT